MRRATLTAGAAILVLLLSACVVSSGYAVRSDVVIEDGGRRLAQSLSVVCTAFGLPNEGASQVVAVGWRHWFVRRDGSFLVLGDLQPCRRPPQTLASSQHPMRASLYAPPRGLGEGDTWLFDSATHPSRADVYDTGSLTREGPIRILSVSTSPSWRPPSSGLLRAFPGLSSLAKVAGADLESDGSAPAIRSLQTNTMSGWAASVALIQGAPPCGASAATMVVLTRASSCAALRPCSSSAAEPCLVPKGFLRLAPGADFASFSISSPAPEPAFIGTLYAPTTLAANHVNLAEGWIPQVCYQGVCEGPDLDLPFRFVLYLPSDHELVRIWRISMGVPPQAFRTHGAFGPPPRLPRRPE